MSVEPVDEEIKEDKEPSTPTKDETADNVEDLRVNTVDPGKPTTETGDPNFLHWKKVVDPNTNQELLEAKGSDGKYYKIVEVLPEPEPQTFKMLVEDTPTVEPVDEAVETRPPKPIDVEPKPKDEVKEDEPKEEKPKDVDIHPNPKDEDT